MNAGRFLALVSLLLFAVPCLAQEDEAVDEWFDRAERYAARGSWSRAAKYYEKVIEVEKEDEEVAAKLAIALDACGRYEDRDALTAKMLALHPGEPAWLARRIDLLIDVGRDDEALELLRAHASGEGAIDFPAGAALGRLHEARGRDAEAEAVYDTLVDAAKERILRTAPELTALADAYLFYARRHAHKQGADMAERALADAQKADPDYLLACERLAEVYGTVKERPSDMKRELRDALKKRLRWPDYQVGLAEAAELLGPLGTGDKREAVAEALKVNPRHPDALFMRGFQELGDARWEVARATFEKALESNPNHLDALSGLAALAYITHDIERFDELRRRVLERDPTFARLHVIVAAGLSERRRWDESLAQALIAAELDPRDYRNHDAVAQYALFLGRDEVGAAALEKANDVSTCGRVWRNNMHLVLQRLEGYATVETAHYRLRLPAREKDVLERYIPKFLEESWRELVERYRFEPLSPVLFDVLERAEDFSVRTMGTTGLGALGVCFGPTVFMDSPGALKPGEYNWCATAHHEMVHVFTLQLSRGRTPRWLTEGLSSYEEVRRNPAWGRNLEVMLHDALHNEKIFGVEDFDAGFAGPRIIFAYYQGNLTCRFIEETWGFDKVLAMLKAYGEDKLTRTVLDEVLETTPDRFDADFRTWVERMLEPMKRVPAYDADATRRFKKAISDGEDVVGNRIKLAWSYFKRRKWVDADAALKPLMDENVRDPRLDLLLGMRAWRDKRRDVAEKHYAAAIEGGLEDHTMFVQLAQLAERRDETDEAIAWWRKAKASNPWSIHPKQSPHLNLARLLRGGGDVEGWAAEIAGFCALADTAVTLRKELISHHLAAGREAEAMKLLLEVHEVTPYDAESHLQLGKLFVSAGRVDAAVAELRTALDLGVKGKQEIDARVALAELLISLDMDVDATYHLERVLEVEADHERARELLEGIGEDR